MTSHDTGHADPIARFSELLAGAQALGSERLPEPTAFCLATADANGRPSARMLLLKDVDARGFVFYTNLDSRKGRELAENPIASMCFHWQPLELQVRIEGRVSRVPDAEADAYFATRERGSQLGAWASAQSEPMHEPDALEGRLARYRKEFGAGPIPRPPHWSGFRLLPDVIEFWSNRPSRLHVRERYSRVANGWATDRLYP